MIKMHVFSSNVILYNIRKVVVVLVLVLIVVVVIVAVALVMTHNNGVVLKIQPWVLRTSI
jgi:hypothetical protein